PQTGAEANPGSLPSGDVSKGESSKELRSEEKDTPPTNARDLMAPSTSSGISSRPTIAFSEARKSSRLVKMSQSTSNHSTKTIKRPRDNTSQAKHGKSKKRKVQSTDDQEDELMDQAGQPRIKVLALKCAQKDCQEMVPDREALRGHLKSAHELQPFQCLA